MHYTGFFSKKTGLIILHPLVVAFLLVSSYPVFHDIPTPFWYVILTSFVLAVIALLLQTFIDEKGIFYFLFVTDLGLIGAIVHFTGGSS
ncbi:hypothetical protein JXB22_03295, partial [candidate division WOR-3 bacterium]|nr:hypothetical protein [candidate division WOR-3 bacterium]